MTRDNDERPEAQQPASGITPVGVTLPVVPDLPVSMFPGVLPFGGMEIPCYVLPGGKAVITTRGIVRFLFGHNNGILAQFLSRIPGGSELLALETETAFRVPGVGPVCHGYETDFVIRVCDLYLDALIGGTIHPRQRHIAIRARVITKASASVGLVGLVYEATGYAKHAGADALRNKLAAVLREQAGKWAQMFEPRFFLALAKLYRLELTSPNRRPLCFSAFMAEFMYDGFDPEVADAIRARNDSPKTTRHHQFFTPEGRARFEAHKRSVYELMETSDSLEQFRNRFNHLHYGTGLQLAFGGAR